MIVAVLLGTGAVYSDLEAGEKKIVSESKVTGRDKSRKQFETLLIFVALIST